MLSANDFSTKINSNNQKKSDSKIKVPLSEIFYSKKDLLKKKKDSL